jgi:glycosyltransferase involved in cell wall biosynthesis
MIRVANISALYGGGGAESMAVQLMRNLDRERFEVMAISLFDPLGTELEKSLARNSIPLLHLGKRRGLDPGAFLKVARALERLRPDVIHTHQYVLRYVLPYMLYRRPPAMVHTVHNLAEKEVSRSGRIVNRLAFKLGVQPVAIAEEVDESIRSLYGLDDLPLIPNGIPVEDFQQPPGRQDAWRKREGFDPADVLFVSVSWLRPQKNPLLLLEAFARGPASNPRARLLFVGKGPLSPELEQKIDAAGLKEQVRLLGMRSDIPEILGAADVFALSSDWEGNPLSVMEAMAAGRPVISTAVGGVPELVEDGGCGLLVPPRDPETLSRAMESLLEKPGLRERLGAAAAERARKRFGVETMTRAYEDLYETMLTRK